jgi:hypothetical protein
VTKLVEGSGDATTRPGPDHRVTGAAQQLISYIAPGAPATRRRAEGDEAFLRPEIGFTPRWYRERLGIDFGERWHFDPAHRRDTVLAMRAELRRTFPGTRIGGMDRPDSPLDLLTGLHGACAVAAMFGVPVVYRADNWPDNEHVYLTDEEADALEPPDLDRSPMMADILRQVDWIAASEGRVEGYLNWQGVLNNALRLRGDQIFIDMMENPGRATRIFDCVCRTIIDAARRLHAAQRRTGFEPGFMTVGNCVVNMISSGLYRDLLLPFDRRLAETFGCLGLHNCAWRADPYMESYAELPGLGYIDMGLASDLVKARALFPAARRSLMYTPMDLANKTPAEIRADLERLAADYAPCDIVMADIEAGTPDERVATVLEICEQLSARAAATAGSSAQPALAAP